MSNVFKKYLERARKEREYDFSYEDYEDYNYAEDYEDYEDYDSYFYNEEIFLNILSRNQNNKDFKFLPINNSKIDSQELERILKTIDGILRNKTEIVTKRQNAALLLKGLLEKTMGEFLEKFNVAKEEDLSDKISNLIILPLKNIIQSNLHYFASGENFSKFFGSNFKDNEDLENFSKQIESNTGLLNNVGKALGELNDLLVNFILFLKNNPKNQKSYNQFKILLQDLVYNGLFQLFVTRKDNKLGTVQLRDDGFFKKYRKLKEFLQDFKK